MGGRGGEIKKKLFEEHTREGWEGYAYEWSILIEHKSDVNLSFNHAGLLGWERAQTRRGGGKKEVEESKQENIQFKCTWDSISRQIFIKATKTLRKPKWVNPERRWDMERSGRRLNVDIKNLFLKKQRPRHCGRQQERVSLDLSTAVAAPRGFDFIYDPTKLKQNRFYPSTLSPLASHILAERSRGAKSFNSSTEVLMDYVIDFSSVWFSLSRGQRSKANDEAAYRIWNNLWV